jgi:hypothetical protein
MMKLPFPYHLLSPLVEGKDKIPAPSDWFGFAPPHILQTQDSRGHTLDIDIDVFDWPAWKDYLYPIASLELFRP